ncbi:hypothetical protein SAMN04487914_13717 [Arthrobacter sp. ok909]|nr:hypothetical protein SAMN04487914_13717 [Arthrobacter sp. ok909]
MQANANRVLDEADKAHTDFISAARQFIGNGIEGYLVNEEPAEPAPLPTAEEINSLNLTREDIRTIICATG